MANFSVPNYDYDSETLELARRQKIADAMQGASLSPMEMPTQPGVKLSPLHAVTKMIQAYMGGQQQREVKSERAALGERYQRELGTGMERFYNTSQGRPGMPEMGPPTEEGAMQPAIPGQAPDRRRAVLDAIASNHPVLQKLGMAEFGELNKAKVGLTAKDLLPHADPASISKMITEGTAGFTAKRELKEVGNILYDPSDMSIKKLTGPAPEQVTIAGDLYEVNQSTGQLKKLDNAPKTTITNTVNIPKAESELQKALGAAEGKRVSEMLQVRPGQYDGLVAIEAGIKLLDQGIYTGIFSDVQRNVNKVTGSFSKQEPAKAARTEQFIAYIGDVVIPRLKDFGGSDTVEELKYLQKVQGGDVTMEMSALRQILVSADAKMRRKIQATDSNVANLKKRGLDLSTFEAGTTPGMPAPLPTTKGTDNTQELVENLDDYIKRKGWKK